jgi:membrane protease subunit (stomatin/prohibitin family)
MDLMLSLFAMQMMQNMTGVSLNKPVQPQVAAPPPPDPPPAPSPTQAAKCLKCSEPLPATAKFCPNCGTLARVHHCSQCGAELQETAKFCPQCGKSANGQ